jgi:hypothetical protein
MIGTTLGPSCLSRTNKAIIRLSAMVVDISRSPLDFNKALKVSNSGACKFSNSNERGIYSASGQLYQPEDSDKVMWYKEDKKKCLILVLVNFLIQTSALAMNHPVFGVECSYISFLRCLVQKM